MVAGKRHTSLKLNISRTSFEVLSAGEASHHALVIDQRALRALVASTFESRFGGSSTLEANLANVARVWVDNGAATATPLVPAAVARGPLVPATSGAPLVPAIADIAIGSGPFVAGQFSSAAAAVTHLDAL